MDRRHKEFDKYLNKSGLFNLLTDSFAKLFMMEDSERPENTVWFLQQHMFENLPKGFDFPSYVEYQKLLDEKEEIERILNGPVNDPNAENVATNVNSSKSNVAGGKSSQSIMNAGASQSSVAGAANAGASKSSVAGASNAGASKSSLVDAGDAGAEDAEEAEDAEAGEGEP